MIRKLLVAVTTLLALNASSPSFASDCEGTSDVDPKINKKCYELSITSTSGMLTRITGSVALMGPDRYVKIDGETPFRLKVSGNNLVFIVSVEDSTDRIDFSLSVDGRVSTTGSDNSIYAIGEGIPKPGSLFSANYKERAKDD